MVIEILTFRLRPGVTDAQFEAADRRLQTEFAYQQAGMIRRTTARGGDGVWAVVDFWRSAADADACLARWRTESAPIAFDALVDDTSVEVRRFETLA